MRSIQEIRQDIEEIKKEIKLYEKRKDTINHYYIKLRLSLDDLYDELEFVKCHG